MRTDAASYRPADTIKLSLTIANSGVRDGDEVPQAYFRQVKPSVPQPRLALCGFTRVHVASRKSAVVEIEVPVERLRH